jgi:hypothetical protein
MRFVACYGMLYRLTEAKYMDFLTHMESGRQPSLDDFGVALGRVDDVTEWTSERAGFACALERDRRQARSKPKNPARASPDR